MLVGGIEAGGTKFVCAVGTGPEDVVAEARFPTTTPDETIGRAIAFFREQRARLGPIAAIGIASFGPVDPDPASPTFGYITSTPKEHWANVDLVGVIRAELDTPIGFDTDVNAAGLGEWQWGAALGIPVLVYLTVGTGIGGGVLIDGQPLHGLIHPELGHIAVPHDLADDPYGGRCPFHRDCLEGLASGPAIEERWGRPAGELADDHPAWELEAHYLALAIQNFVCTLSPQRIVIGGGVMKQTQLYPMIRQKAQSYLNGYVQSPAILDEIDRFIVSPALGERSGVLGAFALAQLAVLGK